MSIYVSQAIKSLIYEVTLAPKPGLVDSTNTGSHTDMDIFTFIDSSLALAPFFDSYYQTGYTHSSTEITLFASIRTIGIAAEKAMFLATNGVNTHKGANFSFGVILAAMGFCHQHKKYDLLDIIQCVKKMTTGLTKQELHNISSAKTHGEAIFQTYGFTGIRGEVENGFPIIINHALPYLTSSNLPLQQRLLCTLLVIMSLNDDTNILSRGGIDDLYEVKKDAKRILELPLEQIEAELIKLNDSYISKNISPGGSADLLALTIFLAFYQQII
jgi:triphosphoribosyl-dephospho-CoA synthase CitG